jgi:ABC-type sugar transport system ATPase subunit
MQGTKESEELDENKLIIMMTGRKLVHPSRSSVIQNKEILIEVKQKIEKINSEFPSKISVHAGEIVGLAGLVGSGRTKLARNIFGAESGSYDVSIIGKDIVRNHSTRVAKRFGIAYLPKDRKTSGLLMNRSIRENVGLASLKERSFAGVLRLYKDRKLVKEFTEKVLLKSSSLEDLPTTLSGGNQQKVMLARWLSVSPTVLILDEPTRGIDVVGKSEIYRLMRQLTDAGRGIVMISSEIEEIISMSDRVYVMSEGSIVSELVGDKITENNIARASLLRRNRTNEETNE